MKQQPTSRWILFTLLGAVCGFALAILLQPGAPARAASASGLALNNQPALPAAAWPDPTQASQPTPDPLGVVQVGEPGPNTTVGNQNVKMAPVADPKAATQLASRSFTFQGVLRKLNQYVNGACNLRFSIWDDPVSGTQVSNTQTFTQTLTNGLFTVTLNDSNVITSAFDGHALWVATEVRCPSGSGAYDLLTPRQALTPVPLADGLAPHSIVSANDTYSGFPAMSVTAPTGAASNPMGFAASAGQHSNFLGINMPVGVWADSGTGEGLWATTSTGTAIRADASTGYAGYFNGKVIINGKLSMSNFKSTLVINTGGPLTKTGNFSSSGGTLLLFYSGSGFSNTGSTMIGMDIYLDGTFVDATGMYANSQNMHLAFVSKQWVLTGIAAGTHTISLQAMDGTFTDFNDIFTVTVLELPF